MTRGSQASKRVVRSNQVDPTGSRGPRIGWGTSMSLSCHVHNLSRVRTFYQFSVDPMQDVPDGDVGHIGDLDADGVEEHGDLQPVSRWVRCGTVEDV